MFAPNKHWRMCKLHGIVLPKRAETKKRRLYAPQLLLKSKAKQTQTSQRARVHTCPKWTVIGLRSSRSLGSLASTSGDGTVFGSCSSKVGAQPFSVMSCREKPARNWWQGLGTCPEHRCSLQPQGSEPGHGTPSGSLKAHPPAREEGAGRLTWLFDF